MKILTNQSSKVYILDDGVTTKEVINTLMQNNTCEVTKPFLEMTLPVFSMQLFIWNEFVYILCFVSDNEDKLALTEFSN